MPKTTAGDFTLEIPGLRQFRSDLRRMGEGYHLALSRAHRELADRVASRARSSASSQGSVAAKTAPSIKASGTLTRAAVRLGGSAYPFGLGAEFGALQYPQFMPWRGNSEDAGYFLYPTIRDMSPEIEEMYLDQVVDELAKIAYPQ